MTFQDYLNITAMLLKEERNFNVRRFDGSIHIYFTTKDITRLSEIFGWYDMQIGEPITAESGRLIYDDHKFFGNNILNLTVYVDK